MLLSALGPELRPVSSGSDLLGLVRRIWRKVDRCGYSVHVNAFDASAVTR